MSRILMHAMIIRGKWYFQTLLCKENDLIKPTAYVDFNLFL